MAEFRSHGRWIPSGRWRARVGDAAALLHVMAGYDPQDSTTHRGPVPDYVAALKGGLKGLRLGVPHSEFMSMMEPDVGSAVQDALGLLKQQGATLVDVRFPPLAPVVALTGLLFLAKRLRHMKN